MKRTSDESTARPADSESSESAAAALAEIERTVNWDSPKLELYESSRCGTGVRAGSSIEKGESIGIFGGHIVPLEKRLLLPAGLEHFYFQVSDDLILTHLSMAHVRQSKIEFINHSCEPNAGFSGQIELVAMRAIQAGEAIGFDYAICTSEPEFRMECFCGAERCRAFITGEDWKNPALQKKYKGYFQPYLERKFRA
ncbi:MAG: SET domain-containing protein-lysine N-methyltransferase [Acidobacteriota bacterium]|nr:SET domain-containing protein-lysine N-methyltransferase [Acidobacteriota bacterium]